MDSNPKKNKKRLIDDKRILLVASLLLAVLAWVIIAGFINPGDSQTISNVSIDYSLRANEYLAQDLQIVSDTRDYQFADVDVSGDGSAIGGLANTDVTVYLDYSGVNGPGEYDVPLRAQKVTSGNYVITDFYLRNGKVQTVPLTFEEVDTKTLTVTVEAEAITAAEGYFRDTPAATPAEITVTGPKSDISRIHDAVAVITADEERTESIIYSGVELTLRDVNGEEVNAEVITFSTSTVEVEIPILEVRSIDLRVDYTGLQDNFDVEWLQSITVLSMGSVQVAGPSSAFDNLSDPYPIGPVDLSTYELGSDFPSVTLSLPASLRTLDSVSQISVSLDSSQLETRTFEVENINVINGPAGATIEPVNTTVSNVTLVGPAEQLDGILPENITIVVDAYDVSAARGGQQAIAARVVVPSANRTFAVGSYSVVCDVTVE